MSDVVVLYLIFSLLGVIMAGHGAKATAEMLKNAVIAKPTTKHTATVGKVNIMYRYA